MSADEIYRKQVIKTFFKNGVLQKLPVQNRKKDVVLQKLASRMAPDKHYSDDELIHLLKRFSVDPVAIKAELLVSRFVKTTKGLHHLV